MLVASLRKESPVRPQQVRIRVETDPGDVAQVDFGYVGRLYDSDSGVLHRAWVFVMVLGYSRKMFARIVFDQTVPTWLRLHVEAFAALGGVPRTIVPDNLKAAVVRAAFGADRDSLSIQKDPRIECEAAPFGRQTMRQPRLIRGDQNDRPSMFSAQLRSLGACTQKTKQTPLQIP